jgi:hypothetical protein
MIPEKLFSGDLITQVLSKSRISNDIVEGHLSLILEKLGKCQNMINLALLLQA